MKKPVVQARGLAELEALRTTLRAAQRQAELERARAQARQVEVLHERELFASTVGAVVPLRQPAVAPLAVARPEPVAQQRLLDEARVLEDSISDGFDVESLLDTDDSLSYRRPGVGAEVVRKLRRGVWATQARIDLHGLRRDAARDQLALFLRESVQAGLRCVRVIHGKGNGSPGRQGVLKAKVKGWLVQRNEVIAFTQARAADGGQGALMVLLEPSSAVRTR